MSEEITSSKSGQGKVQGRSSQGTDGYTQLGQFNNNVGGLEVYMPAVCLHFCSPSPWCCLRSTAVLHSIRPAVLRTRNEQPGSRIPQYRIPTTNTTSTIFPHSDQHHSYTKTKFTCKLPPTITPPAHYRSANAVTGEAKFRSPSIIPLSNVTPTSKGNCEQAML